MSTKKLYHTVPKGLKNIAIIVYIKNINIIEVYNF